MERSTEQIASTLPLEDQTIKNTEEVQYLNLISTITAQGQQRKDRTGTGTISLFAPPPLRFSLLNHVFPLLTTKKTFFRPIFEELMWFIRGKTDSNVWFPFLNYVFINLYANRFFWIKKCLFGKVMVLKHTWILLV
jgi:hypothetical protein